MFRTREVANLPKILSAAWGATDPDYVKKRLLLQGLDLFLPLQTDGQNSFARLRAELVLNLQLPCTLLYIELCGGHMCEL